MDWVAGRRIFLELGPWRAVGMACVLGVALLASCDSANQPTSDSNATSSAPATGVGAPFGGPLAADASLAQTLAHPDPLVRVQHVARILQSATPEQLPEILAEFERAPQAWGDLEYALFVGWWARFDPSAALTHADVDLRLDHPRIFAEAMRTWGRLDPRAAVGSGWLASIGLGSPGWRSEMVEALVTGWFESGSPELEKWLQTEVEPNSVQAALRAYVRMLVLRDGARKTLEWTRTAPFPPDQQRLLLASALNIVARMEPGTAIEYLEIAQRDGIDTRTFAARIVRGWAHLDPIAALDWLLTAQIDDIERNRAVPDVVRLWLLKDENSVETWLAQNADNPWADNIRTQAIRFQILQHSYRVDWPKVMDRVAAIRNEEWRQLEYLWVIQRWKVMYPEAAEAWLTKNSALLGEKIKFANQPPPEHEVEGIKRTLEALARR